MGLGGAPSGSWGPAHVMAPQLSVLFIRSLIFPLFLFIVTSSLTCSLVKRQNTPTLIQVVYRLDIDEPHPHISQVVIVEKHV